MKVIKNGGKIEMTYEEICEDLGYNAKTQFVDVTSTGRITFTCGKPEEITGLYSDIKSHGYEPSKKFISFIRRNFPGMAL